MGFWNHVPLGFFSALPLEFCLPRSFLCLKGSVLNLFLHIPSVGKPLFHPLTFSYIPVTPKLALTFLWSPQLHQPGRTACLNTCNSASLKCRDSPPPRLPPCHGGSGKLSVSIRCSFSPDAAASASSSLFLGSVSFPYPQLQWMIIYPGPSFSPSFPWPIAAVFCFPASPPNVPHATHKRLLLMQSHDTPCSNS